MAGVDVSDPLAIAREVLAEIDAGRPDPRVVVLAKAVIAMHAALTSVCDAATGSDAEHWWRVDKARRVLSKEAT